MQGIAMQSILHAMVEQGGPPAIDFDFVLVVGHFLTRDENIFTFFEAWPKLLCSPCTMSCSKRLCCTVADADFTTCHGSAGIAPENDGF
jgi:hypothetical protein